MNEKLNLDRYAKGIAAEGQRAGSPDDLLNEDEMVPWFRRSKQWFQKKRMKGGGPPYIKMGRTVLYRRSDALAWLESRIATSTAEYATPNAGPGRPAKRRANKK